jgi:hypothetical protein
MVYQNNFFSKIKKLESELTEIEDDLNCKKELIKTVSQSKHSLEMSAEKCRGVNEAAFYKYQNEIKELETKLTNLNNEKEKLEKDYKDKKQELSSFSEQKEKNTTKAEDISEEEKNKRKEEEEKFKEKEEKFKKQEREQYRSSFDGFNEFYKEFQNFNQGKVIQGDANDDISEDVDDVSEKILPKSLLQDEDLVQRRLKTTILYVSTFFPKLSSRDFERIVLFLLKEQKVTVTITSKTTTEKGEVQLIEASEEKELSQVWQYNLEQRDQILGECCLKAVRLEDGIKIIDFYLYYLREDLKTYFEEEHPLFLEENFKRSKFLLFDSASRVTINAIDLSVEMANSNPDAYGQSRLCSIVEYLKILDLADELANQKESEINSTQWLQFLMLGLEAEQREELRLFDQFLKSVAKKQRRQFVFLRLSVLVSQMLAYPQIKDEVESFLDWAIREQHQDAVLEIIKPLQKLQNFNQLYWIKQLLDRGNGELREKAYIFLSSRLEQSTNLLYDRLEYIKNWLPAPDRPANRYSPSNEYALRLLFEYAFEKLSELELKDYGNYPSKYLLFEPLDGSLDDDSKLRLLVEWIFNPGLRYIINPDITTIQVIGSLISDWFNILWGLGNKEAKPEAANIIDNLIKQIKAATDRNQQKDLIQFWNDLSEDLLNQAESASEAGEEQLRKLLIQKRNLVRQLKQQF